MTCMLKMLKLKVNVAANVETSPKQEGNVALLDEEVSDTGVQRGGDRGDLGSRSGAT